MGGSKLEVLNEVKQILRQWLGQSEILHVFHFVYLIECGVSNFSTQKQLIYIGLTVRVMCGRKSRKNVTSRILFWINCMPLPIVWVFCTLVYLFLFLFDLSMNLLSHTTNAYWITLRCHLRVTLGCHMQKSGSRTFLIANKGIQVYAGIDPP